MSPYGLMTTFLTTGIPTGRRQSSRVGKLDNIYRQTPWSVIVDSMFEY